MFGQVGVRVGGEAGDRSAGLRRVTGTVLQRDEVLFDRRVELRLFLPDRALDVLPGLVRLFVGVVRGRLVAAGGLDFRRGGEHRAEAGLDFGVGADLLVWILGGGR